MKKIISFVLVCLMLCTSAIALTGCKKKTDPNKEYAESLNKNKDLAIEVFYEMMDWYLSSNGALSYEDEDVIFYSNPREDMPYLYRRRGRYGDPVPQEMTITYNNVIYSAYYSAADNDGKIELFSMEGHKEMSVEGQMKDRLFLLPATEIETIKVDYGGGEMIGCSYDSPPTYKYFEYRFNITYKGRPGYTYSYYCDYSRNFKMLYIISESGDVELGCHASYYKNDGLKSFVKFNIEPFSTITKLVIDTENINLNDASIYYNGLLQNITTIVFDNHHEDIALPDYILLNFEFSENIDGKAIYIKKAAE